MEPVPGERERIPLSEQPNGSRVITEATAFVSIFDIFGVGFFFCFSSCVETHINCLNMFDLLRFRRGGLDCKTMKMYLKASKASIAL